MARLHGLCLSTSVDDGVEAHHDGTPNGHAWLNIAGAISIFMPHDADEAMEYLTVIQSACDELAGLILAAQPGAGK